MKNPNRNLIAISVSIILPILCSFWWAKPTPGLFTPSVQSQAPPMLKMLTAIVNDDEARMNEGADSVEINVVGNDVLDDPEYALLIVSQPAVGSVALNNNRGLTYTLSDPEFSGCVSFEYGINDDPVPTTANNDFINTLINQSISISVLNNDTDPQNDDLQVTGVDDPAHGTVQIFGGGKRILYTPESDYTGPDTFTYEISDGNGNTSTATVIIDVRLANDGALHFIPPKWHVGHHGTRPTQIWISTEDPGGASGTISLAGTNISQTFRLPDNTSTFRLDLSNVNANFGLTYANHLATPQKQGLKVVSDNNPVNVQIVQENSNGQSFLTSKSLVALGTDFYACQMEDINLYEEGTDGLSFISVMAAVDNTTITFSNSSVTRWYRPGGGGPAGNHAVTLQANETYVVGINNISQSITGTRITADKPIAVSCGSMGVGFTGGDWAVDNGWDQLVPVEKAGMEYVVPNGISNPDKVTFIPTLPSTTINVDGIPQGTTFGPDNPFRLNNSSTINPRYVTSDQPMLVFLSSGRDPGRGENGLALVAPIIIDGRGLYHFRTPDPSSDGGTNDPVRVFFLTAANATGTVKLTNLGTGAPVNTDGWRTLAANPNYSYLEKDLTGSSEFEVSSEVFIQVMMFSASRAGGGLSYISAFEPQTLNANDDQISAPENTPLTFSPLNNDADGEGDVIRISNVGPLQNNSGTIVNNGNGALTYTPNPGFVGRDSLEYTITDGNFNFSTAKIYILVRSIPTATVRIYVAPLPDRPAIVARDVEGVPLSDIPLDISLNASSDTDGSETLAPEVVISGVPPTVTLSAGIHDGAGAWTLSLSDLAGVTARGTVLEEIPLTLTVENIDDAGCDQDGDGQHDTATQSFSYDFLLNIGTACPTIGSISAPAAICSGETIPSINATGFANATLAENWERDFDLEFVYVKNESDDPYAEGVSLGFATPTQGGAGITNVRLPDTAGVYYVYAILSPPSAEADCRTATSTSVQVNAPAPFAIQGDAILCPGASNTLRVPVAADYFWSTGATTQSIDVYTAGNYSVTATDSFGCETSAGITVVENPLSASTTSSPPICSYDANGRITVNLLGGGVGTVLYQINEQAARPDPVFDNLRPGVYRVRVTDESACSYTETIDLPAVDQLSVELPPLNGAIRSDDSLRLAPQVGGVPVVIAWNPAAGLSCTDCLTPWLQPKVPTTYTLTITSDNGCVHSDSVAVDVEVVHKIYAPNAFAPGSQEPANQYFAVSGGVELAGVEKMVVFDRWGNQVYQGQDLLPGDPGVGWDGTINGQPAPAGVYVYYVYAIFADGETEVFSGDVMLVR
jgi:hypothetical protein